MLGDERFVLDVKNLRWTQVLVNGGLNYKGPKVAKFLGR